MLRNVKTQSLMLFCVKKDICVKKMQSVEKNVETKE